MATFYKHFKDGIRTRSPSKKTALITLGIITLYCLLGLAAYWPIYPGDPSKLPGCVCGDQVLSTWFLRWLPFSIAHHLNPLFTSWVNVPYGANLAQNTLMPLLGFVTTPLSILVSPVASFNLLAWLAFPLSASSMFYVTRHVTSSRLAAFVSGLLYGFSPYMIGQGSNHIMLSFIPLPPLITLALWKVLVERPKRKQLWKLSLLLSIEVVAQFFIEPEVLAITTVMIILGIIVGGAMYRNSLKRSRITYGLKRLGLAVVITAACLAYPVWFMTFGPQHFSGSNFPANNPYRSDLIGLVVPTNNQRVVPNAYKQFGASTIGGDYQESGEYIGPVLLIVILVAIVRWRRNRLLVSSAFCAFVCWLLSLGPSLVVNGKNTSIALPFKALLHLPLLQDILPTRFSLGEWFFISFLMALVVIELQKSHTRQSFSSRKRLAYKAIYVLLTIAAIITLLPRWPYGSSDIHIPKLFSSKSHKIANRAIVLTYPFAIFPSDQSMLWQAEDDMRFKLVGGYIQTLSPQGTQSEFSALLTPPTVQGWLTYNQKVGAPWQGYASVSYADVTNYLKNNNINAVIVDPSAINAAAVIKVFTAVLGQPEEASGALLWPNVNHDLN